MTEELSRDDSRAGIVHVALPHVPRWESVLSAKNFAECSPVQRIVAMCVRRDIADEYVHRLATDPRRLKLGRNGSNLLSGEDLDIAAIACEMGFGQGLFAELKLIHLIPKERITLYFLTRIQAGNAYSQTVFRALKGQSCTPRSWFSSTLNLLKGLREDAARCAFRQRPGRETRNSGPEAVGLDQLK